MCVGLFCSAVNLKRDAAARRGAPPDRYRLALTMNRGTGSKLPILVGLFWCGQQMQGTPEAAQHDVKRMKCARRTSDSESESE